MSDSSSKRRRESLGWPPSPVIIPLVVLVVLFAGWSAVWYVGSQRAEAELTEWLERQAVAGRNYDCAERSIGGYPFRVTLDCRELTAEVSDDDMIWRVSAARLHAVAMVWQPEHVIIGMEGPLRVERSNPGSDSGMGIEADWSSFQSSVRIPGGRVTRFDVVMQDARISADPGVLGPGGPAGLTADRLDLHQREEPEGNDNEVAVNATGLVIAHADLPAPEAVDMALLARLHGVPSPMPREASAFVAAWRDNAGDIEILDLRATQGESLLRAEGRLAPDERGRPEGTVTVTFAGPDLRSPGTAGAFGGIGPALAAALRIGGRSAEVDGREAVSGDIDMRDGRARFGPLSLARLPPLF